MDASQRVASEPKRKGDSLDLDLDFGNQVLAQIQADQWVSGWRQHLGDRATPKDLVDAIVGNIETLGKAKKLKEEIINEFTVGDPSSL